MKYGMRKPSVKKSISAKATGKLKRSVKRSVDPLYGKRGAGMIRNPKKSLYNKAYSKTTFSAFESDSPSSKKYRLLGGIAIAFSVVCILLGFLLLLVDFFAVVVILIGAFLLYLGLLCRHVAKDIDCGKYADCSDGSNDVE